MINRTETEERAYLEAIKEKLGGALALLNSRVNHYARNVREQKNYLWEHRADMDHVEKISARESAHQAVLSGEAVLAHELLEGKYTFQTSYEQASALRGLYACHA